MSKYLVLMREVVEDEVIEGYEVALLRDGEEIECSDVVDNFGDAIDDFARLEQEWYEKYSPSCNGGDEWRCSLDIIVCHMCN